MLHRLSEYHLINSESDTLLQIKHLRISGVSKDMASINLDLKKGEIHAIIGESGAGKTGLAHILAGLKYSDAGIIYVNNQLVDIKSIKYSLALGIGVLLDNPAYNYIPHLTVKEYLYLWNHSLIVSNKKMAEKTKKLLGEYDVNVDPNDLMLKLNVEERLLLSLMKVLVRNPSIVVLDEPTSSLSEAKKQHFFRIIRKYAESNNGILYLSNQLDEVLQIGDRVTILKSGETLACLPIEYAKKNPGKVLSLYFGREKLDSSDDEFKDVIDTILHTTELLTSEYELQDLLNLLVKKITEASKASACSILLMDEESAKVMECFLHSLPNSPEVELKEELVSNVIQSGKPLVKNNIKEFDSYQFFSQKVAIQSFVCVPIRVRSKINGAIEVFYIQNKSFSQEDIELLMTFATQVAIAIENSRLLGRSTLLKEAHHRIKNNLQSIVSLLLLQLQTKSEKSLDSIVWQIIDRIKTIAGIHEILSQDEKGIGLINFKNLMNIVITNFNEKDYAGRIQITIDLTDLYITYKTATSLGLVVNELLANCFEHAFPGDRTGKIVIRLQHDDEKVYLEVIDDGIGLSRENIQKCSGTLGLSLVKSLVNRDLHGTISFENDQYTRVMISFPKQQNG
jgi:ribose transport system ATP-binding protein